VKGWTTALAFCLAPFAAQAGCAGDPAPCSLPGGEFHIVLPDQPQRAPVVMFLHGAGSSGGNVAGNAGLTAPFTERGYAVVAPSALPRPGGMRGVWNFYPGWQGRDEPGFLRDVVTAAAERFGTSDTRVLLTGFSAGAFMVTYLACDAPESFPAYAPLAGAFWDPLPQTCAGPVRLFQTHGWRDGTVPIEGRPLRSGQFVQGDVFAAMQIWRAANACPNAAPDGYSDTGAFQRRLWDDCAEGSALEFALHPGGHSIPAGWADMVLDWFEAVVPD
jgi:polyhydroxybutyrate depolymerase